MVWACYKIIMFFIIESIRANFSSPWKEYWVNNSKLWVWYSLLINAIADNKFIKMCTHPWFSIDLIFDFIMVCTSNCTIPFKESLYFHFLNIRKKISHWNLILLWSIVLCVPYVKYILHWHTLLHFNRLFTRIIYSYS